MSKKQWGHGFNEGRDETIMQAITKNSSDRIGIARYLEQIESQIKMLQQNEKMYSDVYNWCATTLDVVNKANREYGTKK